MKINKLTKKELVTKIRSLLSQLAKLKKKYYNLESETLSLRSCTKGNKILFDSLREVSDRAVYYWKNRAENAERELIDYKIQHWKYPIN